jgi:hypothetical protein
MTTATLTPAALDLARTRALADLGVFDRVATIYARRGQLVEARFWSELGGVASVLAELGTRYLARAGEGLLETRREGGLDVGSIPGRPTAARLSVVCPVERPRVGDRNMLAGEGV